MARYLATTCSSASSGCGPIADGLGLSMAQLALAWILREPNVASAIIGASRADQLRDNAGARPAIDARPTQTTAAAIDAVSRGMNRKLVVFVPREALDTVRDALFAAGAGGVGDYERCSWYTEGTGTFLGGEGTSPRVGQAGREERVAELRLETVFPGGAAGRGRRGAAERASVRGAGLRRSTSSCQVKARLFTDGGARGNPGPAAFGYVLEAEDGTVLAAHGEAIGVATNNVAEYRGARRRPRERAAELQVPEVEVVSDSELLVKQMTGEYRVKNEALRALSLEAARLARQVGKVTLHGRPAGAEQARRPARERGSGRGRPRLDCPPTRM